MCFSLWQKNCIHTAFPENLLNFIDEYAKNSLNVMRIRSAPGLNLGKLPTKSPHRRQTTMQLDPLILARQITANNEYKIPGWNLGKLLKEAPHRRKTTCNLICRFPPDWQLLNRLNITSVILLAESFCIKMKLILYILKWNYFRLTLVSHLLKKGEINFKVSLLSRN